MQEIDELFNGNIRPFENLSFNRRYHNLRNELAKDLLCIKEKLGNDDKKLVDKIEDSFLLIEEEAFTQTFRNGFSLGVRLTSESFLNDGNKTE